MMEVNREEIIKQRIKDSTTSVTKTIFPGRTNHHNTLFGGEALAWMDEVAFITATRFCRKPLVTISSDRVDFKKAIPTGTFAELIAKVVYIGNTSLKVDVDILFETMHKDGQNSAISGSFTFVAVNEQNKPIPVICDKLIYGFNE